MSVTSQVIPNRGEQSICSRGEQLFRVTLTGCKMCAVLTGENKNKQQPKQHNATASFNSFFCLYVDVVHNVYRAYKFGVCLVFTMRLLRQEYCLWSGLLEKVELPMLKCEETQQQDFNLVFTEYSAAEIKLGFCCSVWFLFFFSYFLLEVMWKLQLA